MENKRPKRFKLGPYGSLGVGGVKSAMNKAGRGIGRHKLAPYSFTEVLYYTSIYEDYKIAIKKTLKIPYYFSF